MFAAPASASGGTQAVFETWASDSDTFNVTPRWPASGNVRKFHASVQQLAKVPSAVTSASANLHASSISVPCAIPGNAAIGGFPSTGTPTPCIAEEVRRNREQFDYIVDNKLNTKVGLAEAFAKSFIVAMPLDALSVKADWVPVTTLIRWLPQLRDEADVRKLYHTTTSDAVDYALVSLHVSSRQNPNWVWGTFEHQFNPGRCDAIGCADSFGAQIKVTPPNKMAVNTQYGTCPKSAPLKALMDQAKLSPVWDNYCLKATQVDFTAADGTPFVLGNSVIEGIVGNGSIPASSCITCHYYASFGKNGKPTNGAILPFNPSGRPVPAVLEGALQFDFMWGVLLAP